MTKSIFFKRIIIGILILALIVLMAVFVRFFNYGSGLINLVVPWGLIAIFISLYLFEEYNRVRKAKRENRREYMNQHRQELLDGILKKTRAHERD
jgi:amino acid permease